MSVFDNAGYFRGARVIPVLTPASLASGVAISRILFKAGLHVQEITLRTPAGLETLTAIRRDLPELIVGAGSVLTPDLGEAAIRVGARFLVSPGTTEELLEFAVSCESPFLPGAATVSELMHLRARGWTVAKVFPVDSLGGLRFLQSLAGPLPAMMLYPTGGIDVSLAPKYLDLPNVLAIGGSWMAPPALVENDRFAEIKRLAEHAAAQ
jgi:2-dehydro-3-deoxyphosphogluconate aldolase/(4S)-4-hydroxy-2-oxoglutarate aldolase